MLRELSVQEQKYQAIIAVLADGRSVTEVALEWGVSRQSVHAWLRRYEEAGLAGLEPRSTRRGSCPHQMSGVVEAPGAGDASCASGVGSAADPL
jgi:transposase-like protein